MRFGTFIKAMGMGIEMIARVEICNIIQSLLCAYKRGKGSDPDYPDQVQKMIMRIRSDEPISEMDDHSCLSDGNDD